MRAALLALLLGAAPAGAQEEDPPAELLAQFELFEDPELLELLLAEAEGEDVTLLEDAEFEDEAFEGEAEEGEAEGAEGAGEGADAEGAEGGGDEGSSGAEAGAGETEEGP